jgi:biopolymer transport protein ExbD
MAMQTSSGGGYNSEINVTPLVDVVLVLLIIFMVVVPLTQVGYDIEIPKESTTPLPPSESEKQVILAVNESTCSIAQPLGPAGLPHDCRVRLNKEDVTIADLPRRMQEVFRNRKDRDKILFLAIEERLNYEGVIRILDVARSGAGEDLKIGIVTDERLAFASPGAT